VGEQHRFVDRHDCGKLPHHDLHRRCASLPVISFMRCEAGHEAQLGHVAHLRLMLP